MKAILRVSLILIVFFLFIFLLLLFKFSMPSGDEKNNALFRTDRPDQAILEELVLRSEIGKSFSYPQNWRFSVFQKLKPKYQILSTNNRLNWKERGPSGLAGRVRSIILHPQNSNIWWVGSVGGGIWYSDDAGNSWICQTDNLPVLSVSSLAICDSNPDVLYAGTGEGFYNYDAIIGDGIFKTTDGGLNWTQLPSTVQSYDFRFINRIVVHPKSPDTVLAATKTGVFRSFDGGHSWQNVFNNGHNVQQIIANPQNFHTLFISTWRAGVFKSTDLGDHWTFVSEEIENPTRIELAIAPSDTNIVYAAAADTNYSVLGLFKSQNGGRDWINLGHDPDWLNRQGWYNNALIVHPFNPDILFVGGIDIYKLTTTNNSFQDERLSAWYHSNLLPYVHADQHCFAIATQADSTFSIIVTNDGGVFYSNNGGKSWKSKNRGLNVTQFYDVDRNPEADQYIGGTQDNGSPLSPVNPSKTTSWEIKVSGDGFDCAWDDQNKDIVYATLYDSRIYKSISGGDYFGALSGIPISSIFHTPLVMDPRNTQKLISASEKNKIYITYDGGLNWKPVDVDLGGYTRIRMAISEKDSNIVWVASSSRYINVSTDGGRHFDLVNTPDETFHAYVTGIATSPFDSATALVMFGVYGYGKIFRTRDLGETWEDLTHNLPEIPVHCALYMPYDSSQIWIGTDLGIFVSHDSGLHWKYANYNLPAVSVRRMKIVKNQIVAATHGRGIWSVNNDTLITYNLPTKEPFLADLPLPNPTNDSLKIMFTPQGAYDSLQVIINEKSVKTFEQLPAYQDTFYYFRVNRPETYFIYLKGFKDDKVYQSDMKYLKTFSVQDQLFTNFDDGSDSLFSGDLMISLDDSFSTNTLHSQHPYQNGKEQISLLNTPILISDSMHLAYKDIAVIEPGDDHYYYPYPQMWDYVTVEGSQDGIHWQMIIDPYDARLKEEWLTAFQEERSPSATSFFQHDTTLTEIFPVGSKIYLRFRLFADASTNGWGWAIDDLFIGKGEPTGLRRLEKEPTSFNLLICYPNPFNNQITIDFKVRQLKPVTITIYNALGQKVRILLNNKQFEPGVLHKIIWDGKNNRNVSLSSGIYYLAFKAGNKIKFKKLILLR